MNRLVHEKSPYLIQHAHNPVDWYPWGEEAFAKAKAEDKPVLLSVGYSTCHWCHVMAHESFEDEEVAKLVNERFIPVKVDREERPDIDAIYMQVCQAMTGHGGWPLTVFLTPDKKPYYAGTYFPPQGRYGRPGFKEVVIQLYDLYKKDPERIAGLAQEAVEVLTPKSQAGEMGEEQIHHCFRQLEQAFDSRYGGFGREPKFPTPHNLMFLLRYHRLTGNTNALAMVTETLDAMADGGIYDHLGYGFARYSTDRYWLVPHFEKMLYDNALLAITYIEAWQVNKDKRYMTVSREILDYVARAMTSPQGGYYSAEDADSQGVEGKFYVWTKAEVMEVLGEDLGNIFCRTYDITEKGNFEGKNIPNLIGADLTEVANHHNIAPEQFLTTLESSRQKLFAAREKRVHPHKDDKVLTSWNALMIVAQAMAARALGEDIYLLRAKTAFDFIQEHLTVEGRLMARWRDGETRYKAYLDDYAFLLWACHELYAASLDPAYLVKGKKLARAMEELFWDKEGGGYFFYGADSEELIIRPKEVQDGAMPSGNSVAARELIRLARLTGEAEHEDRANQLISAFAIQVKEHPVGYSHLMQALISAMNPGKEVVVLGDIEEENARALISRLQRGFFPEINWLAAREPRELEKAAPFAAAFKPESRTNIYVCENKTCRQSTDWDWLGDGF